MLRAVTAAPDWVTVALHAEVTRWLPGNDQVSVQPLIGLLPVLATVRSAVKPVFQVFVLYVTLQAELPGGGEFGGGLFGGGLVWPPPFTVAEKLLTPSPVPPCQGSKPAWMLVRYHELVIAPRLRTSFRKSRTLKLQLLIADGAT